MSSVVDAARGVPRSSAFLPGTAIVGQLRELRGALRTEQLEADGGKTEADHLFTKPLLTMLSAAAVIASFGSRAVQPSTRRAFSLEVFLA